MRPHDSRRPIFVYFHICLIGEWREIVKQILATISRSGLGSIITELRVGVLGPEAEKLELRQYLKNWPHTILFHSTATNECERPTLARIASDAKRESFYALYLHSKGVTKPRNTEISDCVRDWTNYLLYWLVEQHGLCIVKLLEGFRAVGCRQERSHRFSGHFWWASSEHLQNCVIPGGSYQDQEYFLGLESPEEKNFCCIHSPPNDHFFYKERFPRERYAGDFQAPFEFYGRGKEIQTTRNLSTKWAHTNPNVNRLKQMSENTPSNSAERINRLATITQANSYLEIGVQKGSTFKNVNIDHKDGVDPSFKFIHKEYANSDRRLFECTSDEFFLHHADRKYDIIFIDGLHTFQQTARDFLSSLAFSHERTVWVIDDVFPEDIFSAHPRQDEAVSVRLAHGCASKAWQGDVFKIVALLHDYLPTFNYLTLADHANPQAFAWQQPRVNFAPLFRGLEEIERLDYYWLLRNTGILNICRRTDEALQVIKNGIP